LLKYTGNIVSSTVNLPDVSLFDHLKTTAAIATCLYDVAEAKKFAIIYKKDISFFIK